MSNKTYNRRAFLGTASCAALGSTTFLSTLFNLRMMNAASAPQYLTPNNDYKALVCVLLAGGNDSFNMLVPSGDSEYQEYAATRSNLALAQNALLSLNPTTYDRQSLGLHPSMPEVKQLFDDQKLAFVTNVGTLIEPVTKANFLNESTRLPLGLFSHADQIAHWQTSVPQEREAIGWGGRLADMLQSMNDNQKISMNISLSGKNVFQAGNETIEYTIAPVENGSVGIHGFGGNSLIDQIKTNAVNSLIDYEYQDIFKKTYSEVIRSSQDNHEIFSGAIGKVQLDTDFRNDRFSQSLKMIARVIGANSDLGFTRQTFFVTFGGWDHHDEVLDNQERMLAVVSKGLASFNASLEELGLSNQVTTFTISDFGRTLTSNGNGTDHAWGGNTMVMGGGVKGGDIYGTYPSLALKTDLDVGNGVLIPTTSTDSYFAELARWFGVGNNDLPLILPNVGNFYNIADNRGPLGFMKE